MKFLGKRFMPMDNLDKTKAIFVVGEAADGITRYVALIDLYNPASRWVEIMSITNVSTDPDSKAKPTIAGALREIKDDQEWQAACVCFNEHKVFDEYNWDQVENAVVDQRIRERLTPYNDWWFDRKKGEDNLPPWAIQNIENFKNRFKTQLDEEGDK